MKQILALLAAVGIVGTGAAIYVKHRNADPPTMFRTVVLKKGDITALISASGTLEPQEIVDVGSQVNGPILSLGKDLTGKPIDYDSEVEVGTVLANVDPAVYQSQVDQAKANLLHAQADLGELEAKVAQSKAEWNRARVLRPMKAIADTDYDLDEANWKVAVANLEVGKATVQQCVAALAMAQRNLDYCTIKSPIKGVIIDRRVNIGQTVVSTMSVTSCFLIAKDLTHIQAWLQVNEADIGRIRPGMSVTYTVDAYPNETFKGTVNQIRLNAATTQSVVTYTVVVDTENPDLRLYPYLTANASFQVEHHDNVLKVPNGALRWKPRPQMVAPEYRGMLASAGKGKREGGQTPPATSAGEAVKTGSAENAKTPVDPKVAAALQHAKQHGGKDANPAKDGKLQAAVGDAAKPKSHEHGQVWVKDGLLAKPVRVRIGVTDGSDTEISGQGIEEGTEVIVGEATPDQAGGDVSNPFAPKLFNKSGGPPKARP
ncbi:MAG: efflux RND transporter periplasmic adaptor subunit [Thermoguttaceae bacterium]